MFEGKKILITGGTGSLGQSLTKRLLKDGVDTIRILSRNESKQIEMENTFDDSRLRFFLGDVRDENRLVKATEDIDIVFHTAALKHVTKIEYNPFEGIKTNVMGSQNVINACTINNVEKVVCVSTDKAVSPLNTYGATKLLAEKLFVTANNYIDPDKHRTKFIALRYGNVVGSSGSVIPKFIQQLQNKRELTVTDLQMTRFSITMDEASDFILQATELGQGSEIFVPKLKAYSLLDVKTALNDIFGDYGTNNIGIQPGEKLHEILISKDEMRYTWDFKNMYILTNPLHSTFHPNLISDMYDGIKEIANMDVYSSNNVGKIPSSELKEIIENYIDIQNE